MYVTLAVCSSGVLNDHCSTNDQELSLDWWAYWVKCQHCDAVCPPIAFTPPPNLSTSPQVQSVTPATQNVDCSRTRPEAKGLTAAALLRDPGLDSARLSPIQLSGEGSPHSHSTTKAPKTMLSGASPGAETRKHFSMNQERHLVAVMSTPATCSGCLATLASAPSLGTQLSSLKPAVFQEDFRSPACQGVQPWNLPQRSPGVLTLKWWPCPGRTLNFH